MSPRRERSKKERSFLEFVKESLSQLVNEIVEIKTAIRTLKIDHDSVIDNRNSDWIDWACWESLGFENHEGYRDQTSTRYFTFRPEAPPFHPALGGGIIGKDQLLAFRHTVWPTTVGVVDGSYSPHSLKVDFVIRDSKNPTDASCNGNVEATEGQAVSGERTETGFGDRREGEQVIACPCLNWASQSKCFIVDGTVTWHELRDTAAKILQRFVRRRLDHTCEKIRGIVCSDSRPSGVASDTSKNSQESPDLGNIRYWRNLPAVEREIPAGIGELAYKESHTEVTVRVIRRLAASNMKPHEELSARMAAMVMRDTWERHRLESVPRTTESWEAITNLWSDDAVRATVNMINKLAVLHRS